MRTLLVTLFILISLSLLGCGNGEAVDAGNSIEGQLKAAGAKSGETTPKSGASKIEGAK